MAVSVFAHGRASAPAISLDAVESFLREEGCGPGQIRGPLYRSPTSQIFRLDCREGESWALKVCLDPATGGWSPEAARIAFGSLQTLHALSQRAAPLACARPVGLIEESGTVLMEWVPGRPLSSFLLRASGGKAVRVARQAGSWLAALQLSSGISQMALNLEPMLWQIAALRSGVAGDAAELLRRTAAGIFAEPAAWSCCYGDFKPGNLMVNGRRLVGIDPELACEGPALSDLAHFLNHLAVLAFLPGRFGLDRRVTQAVEEGYQESGLEAAASKLAWLRLHNAIRLLERHRSWSRPPRAWVTTWILERLIARLALKLQQAMQPRSWHPMPAKRIAAVVLSRRFSGAQEADGCDLWEGLEPARALPERGRRTLL